MKYPKNDLWSVRQIEFLEDALEGYASASAIYYPKKSVALKVPGITTYNYVGVLHFPNQDRTIIFEQGVNYGLKEDEILNYLKIKNIEVEIVD